MRKNNRLNYTCDNNVNDKNFDNLVINVKDVPRQFKFLSVKNKTDGVIKRVNLMLKYNLSSNDRKSNSSKGVMDILLNRNFMLVVIVLIFVFSCITVSKTFSLRKKS